MQLLKQSTTATVTVGPVLDADGVAVTTAVLADFSIAKNGSVAVLTGATVTHSINGYYTIALTVSNTDSLGRLDIIVNNSAMSMSNHRYDVIVAQVYDSVVSGSDLLQVDVTQLNNSMQNADRILIGANSNRTVQVTGSNHVAADVHEFQTDVIDSDAIAASAVTEIQAGLATTTQLTTVEGKIDTLDNYVDTEVAAIKATTDKLDNTLELDGAVYRFTANALEQGPSGSTSITVSPLSAQAPERVVGTTIDIAVGDRSPVSVDVFDANDVAVDLSAQGNLEVCIESRNNTDLQVVAHASITIGGTGNRRATWTPNAAAVATVDKHRWSLRTESAKKVLAYGPWVVSRVALKDA
jgi:hypothetical protein